MAHVNFTITNKWKYISMKPANSANNRFFVEIASVPSLLDLYAVVCNTIMWTRASSTPVMSSGIVDCYLLKTAICIDGFRH